MKGHIEHRPSITGFVNSVSITATGGVRYAQFTVLAIPLTRARAAARTDVGRMCRILRTWAILETSVYTGSDNPTEPLLWLQWLPL